MLGQPASAYELDRQSPLVLPAMRMTARSAGSKTLPFPPGPPPPRRLRCVFSRFQGSVSPGLGEPLPPLEPSSTTARTSGSSPDMTSWWLSSVGFGRCSQTAVAWRAAQAARAGRARNPALAPNRAPPVRSWHPSARGAGGSPRWRGWSASATSPQRPRRAHPYRWARPPPRAQKAGW